jgi:predicted ester cyclase
MITEQQFRGSFQRILDAFNKMDWDALDTVVKEFFVADHVWHLPGLGDPVRGHEGFKQGMRHMVESSPGYRATIEDLLVVKDKAAVRLMAHRTNPATGRMQRLTSILITHLEGGKLAEDWQLASPWEDEA